MDLNTAKQAGDIARQMDALAAVLAQIDTLIAEHWIITTMVARAPDEGSSSPAGTTFNLLPSGPANDANSQLALQTAKQTYQAANDALAAQLAGL